MSCRCQTATPRSPPTCSDLPSEPISDGGPGDDEPHRLKAYGGAFVPSRFARLLESYRLATKQPPPPGLVSRPAQRPDARAREELPRVVGEAGRGDRPVQLR